MNRFRRFALLAAGLSTLTPVAGLAQDTEKLLPRTLEPSQTTQPPTLPEAAAPTPGGQKAILSSLVGVVFRPSIEAVTPKGIATRGIDVSAVPLLDDPAFVARLAPFLGKPVGMNDLNEIARLTVAQFRAKDRPLVDVVVPEQDVDNGTVQFAVTEFKAGRISAEGNEWFSDDTLLAAVRTRPGEVVDNADLLDDIDWLNRNPFRHVDLVYERSKEFGRTDVVLKATDRLPFRPYGGWENTGTRSTGVGRALAGFNWGNAFGLDHLMNYQATVSDDVFRDGGGARTKAQSLSYTVPLPWRHRLTFLGVYSTMTPDLPDGFKQKGTAWQSSARYEIPLPHTTELTQQVQLGFDFKRSNNNLEFGGTRVYGNATEIAQAVAEYSGSLLDGWGATALTTTLVYSPGDLAPNNTTEAFRQGGGRAEAQANYVYLRASLERLTRLPEEMTWASKLVGQLSTDALLSSEQLGVGGGSTVRGFQEYQSLGDHGMIWINELRSPVYSPSKALSGPADSLQVVAFVDAGRTVNRYQEAGVQQRATLVGAGLGLRYSIESYLTARLDYGHQLTGVSDIGDGGGRLHASIFLSY